MCRKDIRHQERLRNDWLRRPVRFCASLIEQDSHPQATARLCSAWAEEGFDLTASHAWKPFQEIVDARAVFEISEQGLDRHSCSAKNPAPADRFEVSLDG
jgi:hypothetical protein